MTIRRLQKLPIRLGAALGATFIVAASAATLGIFAEPVWAQQPSAVERTANPASSTPDAPPAAAQPVKSTPDGGTFLSLTEIERRVTATGVRVTEIEVKDRIVEVEGRDSLNREVELVVDRRSGEILSRKIDD